MKIFFIRPIISDRPNEKEEKILKKFSSSETIIKADTLKWGPSSIENEYDYVKSSPFVVEKAKEAEKNGYDGVISYCFANPGVEAAREATNIPIIGSGEAAINLALNLGKKISIITILPNILGLLESQNKDLININRIVSIKSIGTPVLSINDNNSFYTNLLDVAKETIINDKADTIVLGCTGMGGMAKKLEIMLNKENLSIPVVDPAGASLKVMEAIIGNNLFHSKRTYMNIIKKSYKLPY